jgi:hypothetical protein
VKVVVGDPAPDVDDIMESAFKVIKSLGFFVLNPYGLESDTAGGGGSNSASMMDLPSTQAIHLSVFNVYISYLLARSFILI